MPVKRWVITKMAMEISKKERGILDPPPAAPIPYRTLALAQQGRNTFATREEAQARLDGIRDNNPLDKVKLVLGENPDTAEVRECECHDGHFDPMQCVWLE